MHGPFEVGKQYRNHKGAYTVLQIDGDTMLLRYADGSTAKESVTFQARIWENIQEEEAYGEELDAAGGSESETQKTAEIRDLVVRVLHTIQQPWPADVTDQVFLAMEGRPAWLAEYRALEREFDRTTLNSFIGFHVKDVTGMENSGRMGVARSSLIKSYSILVARTD